jgi:hypothetical protein
MGTMLNKTRSSESSFALNSLIATVSSSFSRGSATLRLQSTLSTAMSPIDAPDQGPESVTTDAVNVKHNEIGQRRETQRCKKCAPVSREFGIVETFEAPTILFSEVQECLGFIFRQALQRYLSGREMRSAADSTSPALSTAVSNLACGSSSLEGPEF